MTVQNGWEKITRKNHWEEQLREISKTNDCEQLLRNNWQERLGRITGKRPRRITGKMIRKNYYKMNEKNDCEKWLRWMTGKYD